MNPVLLSNMPSPFLTARWQDLLLVTWTVPDDWVRPHLPPGVELDRWEDSALVSLVAFDFRDTCVGGVRWPGFMNFPELNLRTYVRRGSRRGVTFIREYVPSRIVATLARTLFNEPYRAAPYPRGERNHLLRTGEREHRIQWSVTGAPTYPETESLAHFLIEHDTGFGSRRDGIPLAYAVSHPRWRTWPDVTWSLDVDTAALYGPTWASLPQRQPLSVIAAEGSEVTVYRADALDA